jgi:hypothetical protein
MPAIFLVQRSVYRYSVSPGQENTPSNIGSACPMHANLELGMAQVHNLRVVPLYVSLGSLASR